MPAQLFDQLPKPGLYLITPDGITDDPNGLVKIQSLLTSSKCIAMLQYRDKLANLKTQLNFVTQLQSICSAAAVPLIINDNVQLAVSTQAAGVHLGKDDMPLEDARSILGQRAIIGASCYNDLKLAGSAAAASADYLAFGSMFISKTKPKAVKCPLSLLHQAKLQFPQPIVAIGGITTKNGSLVLSAGADYIAVVEDIFSENEPITKVVTYQNLFNEVAVANNRMVAI